MMKTLFRHVFGFGPSRKHLSEKLEEKNAEIDRLSNLLLDPRILDIDIKNGQLKMDMSVPHWATRAMAASFADTLGDAPNWSAIQIGPMPSDKGMILVTIQKASGETPTELVGKLQDEVEKLKNSGKWALIEENESLIDERDNLRAALADMKGIVVARDKEIAGLSRKVDHLSSKVDLLRKNNQANFDLKEKHRAEIARLRLDILAKDEAIRILENSQKIADLRFQM